MGFTGMVDILLHPLHGEADDPRTEGLSGLLPSNQTIQLFVIFKSELVTLQQDLLHAARQRLFVVLEKLLF